jgi:hypothetical protein
MGWNYHIDVNHCEVNYYEISYMYFLKKCIIPENKLFWRINTHGCYRLLIKTDEVSNKILCTNGKIYLRSKFLQSSHFKKSLINHYRNIGIFVKGPSEIITDKCWMIELVPIREKFNNYSAII